jgi:anti-sigma B factor antagonist
MLKKLVGIQRTVADAPDTFGPDAAPSAVLSGIPDWIRIERVGSHLHVGVAGEIDMASAPEFRSALLETLSSPLRPTAVQVDLSLVSFIDARGVAALAEGCHAASRAGVAFAVNNPQRSVRQMLDIVGLTEVLDVRPAGEVFATADRR